MDARTFIRQVGREEAERVAKDAGTSFGYLEQIAYNPRSKPSPKLVRKLVAASGGRMTPQGLRPDLAELFQDEPV